MKRDRIGRVLIVLAIVVLGAKAVLLGMSGISVFRDFGG